MPPGSAESVYRSVIRRSPRHGPTARWRPPVTAAGRTPASASPRRPPRHRPPTRPGPARVHPDTSLVSAGLSLARAHRDRGHPHPGRAASAAAAPARSRAAVPFERNPPPAIREGSARFSRPRENRPKQREHGAGGSLRRGDHHRSRQTNACASADRWIPDSATTLRGVIRQDPGLEPRTRRARYTERSAAGRCQPP